MKLRSVKIVRCAEGRTVNDDPFLKLRLQPGGYASCFYEDLFGDLKKAYDSKTPVTLEIEESEVRNRRGDPFVNVVGIEDPRQTMVPGT